MREIKFRAWHKEASALDPDFKDKQMYSWDELTDFRMYNIMHPDNFIFMQYTGLLDKYGTEIYEGDIVKGGRLSAPEAVEWIDSIVATDKMDDGYEVGSGWPFGAKDSRYYEVIGNIYENKELLK